MPLSAQERAAIITVAGNWALKSVEGASPNDLASALRATGSIDKINIPFFMEHYNDLISALSDK